LGTWDAGTRGRGDAGTRGRRDAGTRRLGDVGREDVRIRGRGDARGLEDVLEDFIKRKQTTLDFCAEFVKYNFRWLSER